MAAGEQPRYAYPHRASGGGAGDDRTARPGRGGPRPALGGPRRPRAGDRHAEERVRARPADQGRTRRADGPGARRADPRRPGRAHRRHPARPGRGRAGAPARPGPPPAAGQGGRQVGHLPVHRGRRHRGRHALPRRFRRPRPGSLGRPDNSPSGLRHMDGGRHHGVRGAGLMGAEVLPAGSCRPGPGRAARPSKPNDSAAPAMARFRPAPAPTRPAPTCGPASHGSAGTALPPERAGHLVASGRRQARYDADETSTGTGASPVARTGLYVLARARFPHHRARQQPATERAEPVLRKVGLGGRDTRGGRAGRRG